jgi:hypothetical protein
MGTRTLDESWKREVTSGSSKRPFLLRIGAWIMETIISVLLALLAAVVFMWVNGKQHEYDQLEDKRKGD